MAFERKKQDNKVHAFRQFGFDIKNDVMKNIVLLYGEEDYLKRWAVSEIKAKYVNEATELFDFMKIDGEAVKPSEIIKSCETLPMMSERRIVIVDGMRMKATSSQSKASESKASETSDHETAADGEGSADSSDELTEYFENFPETAMLIMVCADEPDKRKKFFKNAKKYGSEYDFSRLDRKSLMGFIKKRFSELGCGCSDKMLAMIVDISGYLDKETDTDLDRLLNDVRAIAAHSESVVTEEDVRQSVSGNNQVYIFDFTDALMERRKDDALAMLRQMLDNGENEFMLLGMICSQIETLLLASEMYEAGYSYRDAAIKLKMHEYRIKLAYQKVLHYNSEKIKKLLMDAYAIDRNVKTGLMDINIGLELFVSNF